MVSPEAVKAIEEVLRQQRRYGRLDKDLRCRRQRRKKLQPLLTDSGLTAARKGQMLAGLREVLVNFNAFDVRLFSIPGQRSTDEHEQGRPLLSVLVVHKTKDMQPGDGFFELAESLRRNNSNLLEAWIAEVQKVYQY